jgi:hypothetical protein
MGPGTSVHDNSGASTLMPKLTLSIANQVGELLWTDAQDK